MKKITVGVILPLMIISFTYLTSCKDRSYSKKQKTIEEEQVRNIENQRGKNGQPLRTAATKIKKLTGL